MGGNISDEVNQKVLMWFGHVERASEELLTNSVRVGCGGLCEWYELRYECIRCY